MIDAAKLHLIERRLTLMQWQLGTIAVLLLPSLWLLARVADRKSVSVLNKAFAA